MGDLFTRLAERAHRQAHTIAPRVPARFERPLSETAPAPDAGGEADSHAAPATAAERTAGAVAQGPASRPLAEERGPGYTPGGTATLSSTDDPALRGHTAPLATPPAEPRPDAAAPRVQPPRPRPDVDASRIRPAVPATLPAPGERPEATGGAARSRTAEPDVHIHIGRLEIRSAPAPIPQPSVSAATAARPLTGDPTPARLSLSAYLRGDDGRPR